MASQVRRTADTAKGLVKEWVSKWRDRSALKSEASHRQITGATTFSFIFYARVEQDWCWYTGVCPGKKYQLCCTTNVRPSKQSTDAQVSDPKIFSYVFMPDLWCFSTPCCTWKTICWYADRIMPKPIFFRAGMQKVFVPHCPAHMPHTQHFSKTFKILIGGKLTWHRCIMLPETFIPAQRPSRSWANSTCKRGSVHGCRGPWARNCWTGWTQLRSRCPQRPDPPLLYCARNLSLTAWQLYAVL